MSNDRYDIAIVGGGPAGLAVAIHTAQLGLKTVVLERETFPRDKACGEGIMPAGVKALAELGVLPLINRDQYSKFIGIRYVQEDGTEVSANFRDGYGLGIRRTALSLALATRAQQVGATLLSQYRVQNVERANNHMDDHIIINSECGNLTARMLIGADGLNSKLRSWAGLNLKQDKARRFGMRQHFHIAPWSAFVEVHWQEGIEAYITPCGTDRIGVAFLWQPDRIKIFQQLDNLQHPANNQYSVKFEQLLSLFPVIKEHLQRASIDSEMAGAGPMMRRVSRPIADRFALVGDAAGYIDAITGEGIALALTEAQALANILPQALAKGASCATLLGYEKALQNAFRRYRLTTEAVLFLSQHSKLRKRIIKLLSGYPAIFEIMLALTMQMLSHAGSTKKELNTVIKI